MVWVAVVAAAIGAFFIVPAGGPPATSLRTGLVGLAYPPDWRPVESLPAIEGVELRGARYLTATGAPAGAGLAVGEVKGAPDGILPAALRARTGSDRLTAEPISLGGLPAYRYAPYEDPSTGGVFALYLVPSAQITAGVVCSAPKATAAEFLPRCERVASTLAVNDILSGNGAEGRSYPARLLAVQRRLNRARGDFTAAIGRTSFRDEQARAARVAARAHGVAAAALADTEPRGPLAEVNRLLVDALKVTQSDLERVARAARSAGTTRGYRAAMERLRGSDAAVDRALAALGRLGVG